MLFLTLLWCLEVVKSSVQPFPSDFEGGLHFLHTGGKTKFCIIEDIVVSYTSLKVEIPVSRYL